MSRLFTFDMDGTLLTDGDNVLPETVEALKMAKKAGHKLIIATGRPWLDAVRIDKDILGLFDYLVCNNGTYFVDLKNDKFYIDDVVHQDAVNKVVNVGKKHGVYFVVHHPKNSYRCCFEEGQKSLINQKIMEVEFYRFTMNTFDELKDIIYTDKITQISLRSNRKMLPILLKETKEVLGDEYEINIGGGVYLDVNPKGSSKLTGLKKLCSKMNEDFNRIVAFGDSENDIEMFKGTKLNFAMGNASNDVKSYATHVIGDNFSPALSNKIKELI